MAFGNSASGSCSSTLDLNASPRRNGAGSSALTIKLPPRMYLTPKQKRMKEKNAFDQLASKFGGLGMEDAPKGLSAIKHHDERVAAAAKMISKLVKDPMSLERFATFANDLADRDLSSEEMEKAIEAELEYAFTRKPYVRLSRKKGGSISRRESASVRGILKRVAVKESHRVGDHATTKRSELAWKKRSVKFTSSTQDEDDCGEEKLREDDGWRAAAQVKEDNLDLDEALSHVFKSSVRLNSDQVAVSAAATTQTEQTSSDVVIVLDEDVEMAEVDDDFDSAVESEPVQRMWPHDYPHLEIMQGLDMCKLAKETFKDTFPVILEWGIGYRGTKRIVALSKKALFSKAFPSASESAFDEKCYDEWMEWWQMNSMECRIALGGLNNPPEEEVFRVVLEAL